MADRARKKFGEDAAFLQDWRKEQEEAQREWEKGYLDKVLGTEEDDEELEAEMLNGARLDYTFSDIALLRLIQEAG